MRLLVTLLFAALSCPAGAAAEERRTVVLVAKYQGRHPEAFTAQWDRVRLLARQAQLECSARLGLIQYRDGFQYPLQIRFEDGAPAGIENALAYVRLRGSSQGFEQELVVNLDTMAENPMDFDQVFYHEMTHAVLNDAVGGAASMKIPPWVQEGLAQYVSGEGADRVKKASSYFKRSQAHHLLFDLDGPYTGRAYPQYFLAIQYLYDRHSINAVQGLVRNLIAGMPTADAIQDSTSLPWEKFQDNVKEYSLKTFQDHALPDF